MRSVTTLDTKLNKGTFLLFAHCATFTDLYSVQGILYRIPPNNNHAAIAI